MNKVQIKFLEEALDNEEHLTEWEAGFINNLVGKEERDLSEKQNEVLNRIQKKLHSMNLL
jgi:hypothetical protein